jgi:hypothetical protein
MADDCTLVRKDGKWPLIVEDANTVMLNGTAFTGECRRQPGETFSSGMSRSS